jgi:hypothetical protein
LNFLLTLAVWLAKALCLWSFFIGPLLYCIVGGRDKISAISYPTKAADVFKRLCSWLWEECCFLLRHFKSLYSDIHLFLFFSRAASTAKQKVLYGGVWPPKFRGEGASFLCLLFRRRLSKKTFYFCDLLTKSESYVHFKPVMNEGIRILMGGYSLEVE